MAQTDHVTTLHATQNREHVMPQNLDAERAVLAAMILSPDILEEVFTKVQEPSVFYRPAHQKIFESIMELYERNIPVDQLSLAERLQARGELDEIGGKPYIIELANNSFALANWASHLEIVMRTSMLRALIGASAQISALSYDAPDDLDMVVEDAEKLIMSVTQKRVSESFKKIYDLVFESFKKIEEMSENKSHLIGVPTGFTELDKTLAGLREGSLTVLAARPGVGKTAFALNLAINAAKEGISVAIFSLEMAAIEIMPRLLSSESHVDLKNMRSGDLKESEWISITQAGDVLSKLDISIDDTPSLSILELRAKARRQLRHCKDGKGLIIIDYLQLMQPQGRRSENRQVEIAEISRGLKILAKEMHLPIIALSQLSRAVESRGDKRPMLSDLRESGAIEQDADIVMFIDRSRDEEEACKDNRPSLGTANLIIAKNRNGPIRDVSLVFLDACTLFANPAFDVD